MGIQDIDRNTILEKGMRGYTLEYLDIDGNTRKIWKNKDRDGITQNGKGVRNYKWE